MSLKAVIFDLDGVLADACSVHREALNQALREVANYEIPEDELSKFEGLPTKNKLLILSNEGNVAHDLHDEVNRRKQELTHEMLKGHIIYSTPLNHMMWNIQRNGLKIAVVTNCTAHSARMMLEQLGVSKYIDLMVTPEQVKHPKPDPEGLLLAMRVMGVDPDEVIYVGDQPVDAAAAHRAGIEAYVNVQGTSEVSWELLRRRIEE